LALEEEIYELEGENADDTLQCGERMLLVYETHLKQLLKYCIKCGSIIDGIEEKKRVGSQYTLKLSCANGCLFEWSSQPQTYGTKGTGNVSFVAATEMAGITVQKMFRFVDLLNLKMISERNYYYLRESYVYPAIDHAWKTYQSKLYEEARLVENGIRIAIDGQCDSPGHNASYCTVTATNVSNNKVIDFQIVHVKEVKNSQVMEKEGFVRLMDNLIENNIKIEAVATDRHVQIKKIMREDIKYKHILHQFDPWHIAKGIQKKLASAAKSKGKSD